MFSDITKQKLKFEGYLICNFVHKQCSKNTNLQSQLIIITNKIVNILSIMNSSAFMLIC